MIQCSCTKSACPVCVRASPKPEATRGNPLTAYQSLACFAVIVVSFKNGSSETTCKLGHGAKGMESRVSDSGERLYFFLLCQGRVIAHACWNGVNMGFLPICNSHFK